jgi:hypothetical protein
MYGYTYTGPMAHYTSGTEYNTWLNSSLGGSMFGSGQAVADVINTSPSIPDVNVESLINAFPDAQDTATYTPETFFPDLNPNQVGTVTSIGPAPETTEPQDIPNNEVLPPIPVEPPPEPEPPSPTGLPPIDTSTLNPNDAVTPPTSTGLPPVVDNGSSGNVLTAAGLANALSMLIPEPTPPPPPPPSVVGPSSGGTFNPAPIQRLSFSSPQLAPIGSSNQIDYVKQIRAGLFRDLI